MTATETGGPGATDAVGDRLRRVDERLDELADLVGSADAQVAAPMIERELEVLRTELRELDVLAELVSADDPFASARVAVAVRRERLGFIGAALRPGEGVDPELRPLLPPPPEAVAATGEVEGARATSYGRWLSIVGLVIVGFFAYQLTASSLVYEREQRVLLRQFEADAPEQAANPADLLADAGGAESGLLTPESASGEELPEGEEVEPEVIPAAEAPERGEPIGIIQIPKLQLEDVVVQGSGPAELRRGPGHLRGTVMPGEPGNAAIAGARIGGGAPFKRLQQLDEGDAITVTTAVGGFDYEVRSVRRVAAGDPDPVRVRGGGSTLTLVTSTPKFLAYDRLVVVAELQTKPVAPRFSPVTPDRTETGFDTTPGGVASLVVWGAVLVAAVIAARWLYRRWPGRVAYVLTTPVFVALAVLVFESLAGVLPATF